MYNVQHFISVCAFLIPHPTYFLISILLKVFPFSDQIYILCSIELDVGKLSPTLALYSDLLYRECICTSLLVYRNSFREV